LEFLIEFVQQLC